MEQVYDSAMTCFVWTLVAKSIFSVGINVHLGIITKNEFQIMLTFMKKLMGSSSKNNDQMSSNASRVVPSSSAAVKIYKEYGDDDDDDDSPDTDTEQSIKIYFKHKTDKLIKTAKNFHVSTPINANHFECCSSINNIHCCSCLVAEVVNAGNTNCVENVHNINNNNNNINTNNSPDLKNDGIHFNTEDSDNQIIRTLPAPDNRKSSSYTDDGNALNDIRHNILANNVNIYCSVGSSQSIVGRANHIFENSPLNQMNFEQSSDNFLATSKRKSLERKKLSEISNMPVTTSASPPAAAATTPTSSTPKKLDVCCCVNCKHFRYKEDKIVVKNNSDLLQFKGQYSKS
ncbi:hypothetical protein HELRODRAFT_170781 [Helobdella robusta]|uniref:Uncharacterized protein n=1 Tax=Helobdella robusta TaxID=6412 RepID=T1F3F2_HELRO|nr:hypothetical protein HELRODRAFT_170781 [Helobdella robusta]ESO06768.1 hypothetical protein HELRODRAFT_170781 [Helobdella robusta]